MVLAELVIEMRILKRKINQLVRYINKASSKSGQATDSAMKKLLILLDKYRSHLILINEINNKTIIEISGTQLSLANAIIIIRTIEHKLELLDNLIESDDCVIDKISLIEQRDKFLDEHTAILKEINFQEWRITVDKEGVG